MTGERGHHPECVNPTDEHVRCLLNDGTPEPVFDDEFGLCMDPCEHPSINGATCAACGQEVPDGS